MYMVRVDPHVHLYDTYCIEKWSRAAVTNLGVSDSVSGVLIVVDRAGQDSFKKLRTAVAVGKWEEASNKAGTGEALAGVLHVGQKPLYVVRGVQYVSGEKLEVLGFGVARSCPDGRPCRELVELIRDEGGVACMPWSPGKWLGPRGIIVKELLREQIPDELVFGDIAIHSRFLPRSPLLERARAGGFGIIPGTDPLPRAQDAGLVGTYGVELKLENRLTIENVAPLVLEAIANDFSLLQTFGRPNSLFMAARRFISTL